MRATTPMEAGGYSATPVLTIARLQAIPSPDLASFGKDEPICLQGGPADHLYRIRSGVVRLTKLTPDGRRCVLEFLLPGDVFGAEAGPVCGAAAEAATAVLADRIPRALLTEPTEAGRRLREAVARRLALAQERLLRLACLSATERTAACLLEMAERFGQDGEVTLPMSRADLADYLGLRPETLCRVLGRLRGRGAIAQPSTNRIVVRSRARLVDAANEGRCAGGTAGRAGLQADPLAMPGGRLRQLRQ